MCFYEMPEGKFIPGERVGVTMPLTDSKDGLTSPWSAVVFDIHGEVGFAGGSSASSGNSRTCPCASKRSRSFA